MNITNCIHDNLSINVIILTNPQLPTKKRIAPEIIHNYQQKNT